MFIILIKKMEQLEMLSPRSPNYCPVFQRVEEILARKDIGFNSKEIIEINTRYRKLLSSRNKFINDKMTEIVSNFHFLDVVFEKIMSMKKSQLFDILKLRDDFITSYLSKKIYFEDFYCTDERKKIFWELGELIKKIENKYELNEVQIRNFVDRLLINIHYEINKREYSLIYWNDTCELIYLKLYYYDFPTMDSCRSIIYNLFTELGKSRSVISEKGVINFTNVRFFLKFENLDTCHLIFTTKYFDEEKGEIVYEHCFPYHENIDDIKIMNSLDVFGINMSIDITHILVPDPDHGGNFVKKRIV